MCSDAIDISKYGAAGSFKSDCLVFRCFETFIEHVPMVV